MQKTQLSLQITVTLTQRLIQRQVGSSDQRTAFTSIGDAAQLCRRMVSRLAGHEWLAGGLEAVKIAEACIMMRVMT